MLNLSPAAAASRGGAALIKSANLPPANVTLYLRKFHMSIVAPQMLHDDSSGTLPLLSFSHLRLGAGEEEEGSVCVFRHRPHTPTVEP